MIARKYLKVNNYDRISEVDRSVTHFIDIARYNYYDYTSDDFAAFQQIIDFDEIVRFERVFRYEFSNFYAMEMVYGCTKFFLEFFKVNSYDILLTHSVDEFVLDILIRVAKYYGVEVIAYCANSYDARYMQITERGEHVKVREPDQAEIDNFLIFLQDKTSKPYSLSSSKVNKNVFKKYFVYKVKYFFHYQILHKMMGRNTYRFLMTRSETYPRNLRDILGVGRYFYQKIDQIAEVLSKEQTVYIPLHYHPEATTDYWIQEKGYPTYYPSLFKTLRSYSERGYSVLVKEHPASYMQRDIELYKAISKIPRVYLLSPFITTYDVLDRVEYVVVWTGTSGVEAIMQNKKVILAAGENYYSFGKLATLGKEYNAQVPSETDKRELAAAILSSFLPIDLTIY